MKSLYALAKLAHEAHVNHGEIGIDRDEAQRRWTELNSRQEAKWVAAVKAVADEVKHLH